RYIALTYPKRPIGNHPSGMGHRRERECLPENRNSHTAPLEHPVGLEHEFLPFGVSNVEGEHRIAKRLYQFIHPLLAIRELPVTGHAVGLQQFDAIYHVLAFRTIGTERALQRFSAACPRMHLRPPFSGEWQSAQERLS